MMALRQVGIGATFTARDRMTGDVLALGVAIRHGMDSPLHMGAIVENTIEVMLFGEAAQPTRSLLALGRYITTLMRMRRMHVKTW